MRRLTIFLLPMIASLGIQAFAAVPDTLAQIGAQMEQHPVVRADFSQSKQMSALKRPLVTSGRIVFSSRHGVLWQIDQPYRIIYVLGEQRIIEITGDGARRERSLRDVPGLAQIGSIFRAVLGANVAALRENFDVSVQGHPGKWEIKLVPLQAQLAQLLGSLELSGGSFVESIRINETGGDITQIRFRNTHAVAAPDQSELRLFGGEPGKP